MEITFLEIAESLLVYFGISALAQKLFLPHIAKFAGVDKSLLTQNLKDLEKKALAPKKLARIGRAKAALILAPLGFAAIGGECAIAFAKNLLTLKLFKKRDYSDIVALSKNKADEAADKKETRRNLKGIAISVGTGLLVAAGGLLMAKRASKAKTMGKFNKWVLNKMDYKFDPENPKRLFGMGFGQLAAYMAIFVGGYMASVRDSLERKEVLTRIAVVLPNLLFGAELIKKGMINKFGRKVEGLLKKEKGKFVLKKSEEIYKFAKQEAAKTIGKHPGKKQVDLAEEIAKPMLRKKNLIYYIPYAIDVFIVGLGTALVNRFWTKVRFKQEQKQKALMAEQNYLAKTTLPTQQRTIGFDGFMQNVYQRRQSRFGSNQQQNSIMA